MKDKGWAQKNTLSFKIFGKYTLILIVLDLTNKVSQYDL